MDVTHDLIIYTRAMNWSRSPKIWISSSQ